jgi:single-strand DNA-binding protein
VASLNRIILLGTVDTDPDVKATTSGDTVANFTLKVNRPRRADGLESKPDIIKIVAWRQLADTSGTLSVGQSILVEGRIHTRNYEDQSGNRRYVTEVEAKEIRDLGSTESSSYAAPSVEAVQIKKSQSEPVVEPMDQTITPFQFDDVKNQEIKMPPSFGKEVEEDIPF